MWQGLAGQVLGLQYKCPSILYLGHDNGTHFAMLQRRIGRCLDAVSQPQWPDPKYQ